MYSPPPLDGFSPPPMSDFSPPPLSDVSPLREYPPSINGFSENGDDEEDLDYDFPINDAQYDMTGLSEKLNSLEIDKINNLPPREILELKKESSEVNNFFLASVTDKKNGIKTRKETQIVMDKDDLTITCELPSSESNEENRDHATLSSDIIEEDVQQYEADPPQDLAESLVNGRDLGEGEDDNNFSRDLTIEQREEQCQDRLSEAAGDSHPQHVDDYAAVSDPGHSEQGNNDEGMEEDINGDFNSDLSKSLDIIKSEECLSPINQKEIDGNSDAFGDFSTYNGNDACGGGDGWGIFEVGGDPATGQDWCQPPASSPKSPSLHDDLQFDDSDDEFGDFGEAGTSIKVEEKSVQFNDNNTIVKTLETLSEASEQLLRSVFVPLGDLDDDDDDAGHLCLDVVVMEESGVFEAISNPASCPALDHQWRDSAAHNLIMETLGIDSRVLVRETTNDD